MRTVAGSLSFAPQLPEGWTAYSFKIVYRGRRIELCMNADGPQIRLLSGEALVVTVNGEALWLLPEEA